MTRQEGELSERYAGDALPQVGSTHRRSPWLPGLIQIPDVIIF